jgi:rSAM/selenodomain-associated transferase 2
MFPSQPEMVHPNVLSISIIIPTLNEGDMIGELLGYLHHLEHSVEIIVVDAGSSDDTIDRAKSMATIVHSPRGRGLQMNNGARFASGDILWFLHADCRPHPDSLRAMGEALTDPAIVGGAFEYNLDHPGFFFRLTEMASNAKNHLLRLVYGDMGIFVRRTVFESLGGYKEIPVMEDMDFCKRLKRQGDIVILPYRINTSARRWMEEGIIKTWFRGYILQLAWVLGVSPDRLAKWYTFG